jgi:hypothetical protein
MQRTAELEAGQRARRALEHAGMLRNVADLDLLLFFARHPRTLLTSEQLATFLGYEINQIAESLDLLLQAGILTRTQNPTHAARLYAFTRGHDSDGWIPGLLQLVATREGRLALRRELRERRSGAPADSEARIAARSAPARPVLVRGTPSRVPGAKAG